ncbi:uncharacterized protein LOC106172339 [Lingula anatina]|uniref:Uncharacterized protein LOC106172339 n=1 Tax=Lingula anatina TaxID=7574 RepID=A0A1S3JDF2_LINAN|nr:uncharacterized protein LOC106172339 [Lingula anatina]XP_013408444.1 uncharacterized protein LOC106172339 [Lingula anatina]XP_013408445.1 uncharacterized protein LOC106172339 [Lingula anatina]|eukprot:XP_013408443.1 uncharacterized protein LOC106172339 [Lingula anatina]
MNSRSVAGIMTGRHSVTSDSTAPENDNSDSELIGIPGMLDEQENRQIRKKPHSKELVREGVWLTDYTVPRFNTNLLSNSLSARLRRAVPGELINNAVVMHKIKRENMRDMVRLSALTKQLESEMHRQNYMLQTEGHEILKRQQRLRKNSVDSRLKKEKLSSQGRSKSIDTIRLPSVCTTPGTASKPPTSVSRNTQSAPSIDPAIEQNEITNEQLKVRFQTPATDSVTSTASSDELEEMNVEKAIEAIRISQKEAYLERMNSEFNFAKPVQRDPRQFIHTPQYGVRYRGVDQIHGQKGILKRPVYVTKSAPATMESQFTRTSVSQNTNRGDGTIGAFKIDAGRYLKLARPSFKFNWLPGNQPKKVQGVHLDWQVTSTPNLNRESSFDFADRKAKKSTIPGELSKELRPVTAGLNTFGTSENKIKAKILKPGDITGTVSKVLPRELDNKLPIVMANKLNNMIEQEKQDVADEAKPSSRALGAISELSVISEGAVSFCASDGSTT